MHAAYLPGPHQGSARQDPLAYTARRARCSPRTAEGRPAGRRPRRVAGGLNRGRGALTGTLTLSRWRRCGGTDARGTDITTEARAHTTSTSQPGPRPEARKEQDDTGLATRDAGRSAPWPTHTINRGPGATVARPGRDECVASARTCDGERQPKRYSTTHPTRPSLWKSVCAPPSYRARATPAFARYGGGHEPAHPTAPPTRHRTRRRAPRTARHTACGALANRHAALEHVGGRARARTPDDPPPTLPATAPGGARLDPRVTRGAAPPTHAVRTLAETALIGGSPPPPSPPPPAYPRASTR